MTGKDMTRLSLDEIGERKGGTRADAPEGPSLGPAFWERARVVFPEGRKQQLTLRLDAEVVAWFKAQGKGYQTRMNAVLRAFYEARREQS